MTGAHHPTVTIYNHMDVQPAQEPEWKQAPFAFKNENGLYHGRGATDDKGPALSALFGARYAIEQGFPINVRFLWELEEEIGSPNFSAGLKNREAISCPDSVVVSDTIWLAKGKPAMPYGLRGLLGARLTLRTGTKDAHSGVTGGAARNPLAELMEVALRLRRCQDRQSEDPRVLQRCCRTDESGDQELPRIGFPGQELQAGLWFSDATHERSRRDHAPDLGCADV